MESKATMRELEEDWSFDDVMMANELLDAIEAANAKAQREANRG